MMTILWRYDDMQELNKRSNADHTKPQCNEAKIKKTKANNNND